MEHKFIKLNNTTTTTTTINNNNSNNNNNNDGDDVFIFPGLHLIAGLMNLWPSLLKLD